jgi:ATP phosphoribosyltransferase
MELAPIVGLSDVIVDLVSSGKTLEANNLVPIEEIGEITSRLIVNKASLKINREVLQPMIDKFSNAVIKINGKY